MFNIKVYEKDGVTLKQTVNIEKLESISSFSSQINGGFSNITLSFAFKFEDSSISKDNIIEIQFGQRKIYVGFIVNIERVYTSSQETINITAVGLGSLMKHVLTNKSFNDTISNIVKTLINDFNIEYGSNVITYDLDSIPNSSGNISIDFSEYTTIFDAIIEVAEVSGLVFSIGINGKAFFRQRNLFETHILTLGLDIDSITIDEDFSEEVNELILDYDGGIQTYTAQNIVSKKQRYLDKSSSIKNLDTANSFGNSYLLENSEKKKVSLILNNEYSFFDIVGGDLITIRNTKYEVNQLQVARITYNIDNASIELEEYDSFAKEIFKT